MVAEVLRRRCGGACGAAAAGCVPRRRRGVCRGGACGASAAGRAALRWRRAGGRVAELGVGVCMLGAGMWWSWGRACACWGRRAAG